MFFLNAYFYVICHSNPKKTLLYNKRHGPNPIEISCCVYEEKKKRESFILLNNIKHFGITNYKLYIIDIYYRYIPKSQNIKIEKKRVYKY